MPFINETTPSLSRQPRVAGTLIGSPLPAPLRHEFEVLHGVDFSNVRVHQNMGAVNTGALAYTQGNNIHFMPGRYDPNSQAGRELIGHELTHVVQQRGGLGAAIYQASSIPTTAGDEAGTAGGRSAAAATGNPRVQF